MTHLQFWKLEDFRHDGMGDNGIVKSQRFLKFSMVALPSQQRAGPRPWDSVKDFNDKHFRDSGNETILHEA